MNFIHTSNESHHLEGEIHQGGEKGQKSGEYLIHFHQKSEGKVNLGIDSSEFHFLLVPQCSSPPMGADKQAARWVWSKPLPALFSIMDSHSLSLLVGCHQQDPSHSDESHSLKLDTNTSFRGYCWMYVLIGAPKFYCPWPFLRNTQHHFATRTPLLIRSVCTRHFGHFVMAGVAARSSLLVHVSRALPQTLWNHTHTPRDPISRGQKNLRWSTSSRKSRIRLVFWSKSPTELEISSWDASHSAFLPDAENRRERPSPTSPAT